MLSRVVIALILAFVCVFTQIPSASARQISCTDYLGRPFDLKKGIFLPGELFLLTPDPTKKFYYGSDPTPYDVPYEVNIANQPFVQNIVHSDTFDSYTSYVKTQQRWFNFKAGLEAGAFGAGFQYNEESGSIYRALSNSTVQAMNGFHLVNLYSASLDIPERMKYHLKFMDFLARLPAKIVTEKDRHLYEKFIEIYGTHYASGALFGAKVNFYAYVKKVLTQHYHETWINTQFRMYFHYYLFNVSEGGYENRSKIEISQDFLANAEAKTFFYGGDPLLANLNKLGDWISSIKGSEYPFNVTLRENSELVQDDPVKQATLSNFIWDYINGKSAKRNTESVDILDSSGCLGFGFDPVTARCSAKIFDLNSPAIHIVKQKSPETKIVKYNATYVATFDGSAQETTCENSGGFLGFGSRSKTTYKYYEAHLKEKESLSINYLQVEYETHTLIDIPIPPLNPRFVEAWKQLPRVYDRSLNFNVAAYQRFLQAYGYAYVEQVKLGGRFRLEHWFKTYYAMQHSIEWVEKQSNWSFLNIIGTGHGSKTYCENTDREFYSKGRYEWEFIGGSYDYDPDQWKLWLPTIKENPAMISYKLKPIANLITDHQIKANILRAYEDYAMDSVSLLKSKF
jgi:hypothetical protein